MLKIKICGITNPEDATLASELGAWALGFIFYPNSPRYIKPEQVYCIATPENIERIGVFVNESLEDVIEISKLAQLTIIQLHGDEDREYCLKLKEKCTLPLIKAFRINDMEDLEKIQNFKEIVSYTLLDSYSENAFGGTGKAFDHGIALEAKGLGIPLILSGGLNPENILSAQSKVNPYAFDLSSGVEKHPGLKDHHKLKALFKAVSGQ